MRGSHWVWLLVLAAAALHSERAASQDGKEFTPKNGMYTVTVPEGEKSSQRTQVFTSGKHKVPLEGWQSLMKDGTTFLGASLGIPAVAMREIPADKRFDVIRDAVVKQLSGKVKDEKDIKQDPVPGKEYLVELP